MKFNKLGFVSYIKNVKLNRVLYLIASLIILIPISIVLITDVPFSKIFIGIAGALVIIGKLFTLIKKKKGDKSIPVDIGITIGLVIAFILHVLK